jgi:hypothetical protein
LDHGIEPGIVRRLGAFERAIRHMHVELRVGGKSPEEGRLILNRM